MAKGDRNNLTSSVISDIKKYTGTDPLFPWLQGIRKLRESLPPELLKEKLPPFLSKCILTFETDKRYRNDVRFLEVCMNLMDFRKFVDPRTLLKRLEENGIGRKLALFYQAYALYFEKNKRFEEAEKMYHLGVQNLAEPITELQKAYEKFLSRIPDRKRKTKEAGAAMTSKSKESFCKSKAATRTDHKAPNHDQNVDNGKVTKESVVDNTESHKTNTVCNDETAASKFVDTAIGGKSEVDNACHQNDPNITIKNAISDTNSKLCEPLQVEPLHRRKSQQIRPKSEQRMSSGFEVFHDENLNGMRENKECVNIPTSSGMMNSLCPVIAKKHRNDINTDAMKDINKISQAPLEVEPLRRRNSDRRQPKSELRMSSGFEVFVDEDLDNGMGNNKEKYSEPTDSDSYWRYSEQIQPKSDLSSGLEVFIDEGLDNEMGNNREKYSEPTDSGHVKSGCPALSNKHGNEKQPMQEPFIVFVDGEDDDECSDGDDDNNNDGIIQHPTEVSDPQVNSFVFPRPNDLSNESQEPDMKRSSVMNLREDTVVGRFVGSTILDEPEVENACHHGLVEPTANLKEAMDDINSMFGKPIDFVRTTRPKKQAKPQHKNIDFGGFSILADDDLNHRSSPPPPRTSSSGLSSKLKGEQDFFEPTCFTKEAMDEINEMFGKPLDF